LDSVLTTLYLLFNEGYYSESEDSILREDLCFESIRLAEILIQNEKTNLPKVNALLALMNFHASRFKARRGYNGEIILYEDQDESKWDQGLITRGIYFFRQSSQGNKLSKYHLEAGIAFWHTQKKDTEEKWDNILLLYNYLLQIEYSPVAALNRTYAVSKVKGKQAAIQEAEKLNLPNNPYYFTLLGELYEGIDSKKSIANFHTALSLAKTKTEQQIIQLKLKALDTQPD
jgi:RNA polymerase sigma-70 factor (ECF subfamily)